MNTAKLVCLWVFVVSITATAKAVFVPVSLEPAANEFQYRLVDPPIGMVSLLDVPFDIPTVGNNAWSAHVGTTIGVRSTTTMELPMSVFGATAVHTLINLGWGDPGGKLVTATFIGTGGANYSVELETGVDVRNWLETPYCCNTFNGTTTQQVWEGEATQYAGFVARIDKQRIALPSSFTDQTLTKFILTDNGISGDVTNTIYDNSHAQRSLIYGVTVEVTNMPDGDYNDNGIVDAADFTIWRDTVGNLVTPCTGADANCNGFVENAEYFTWRDQFGESAGSGSLENVAVPEPTSLSINWSLLGLVGVVGSLRRRRDLGD